MALNNETKVGILAIVAIALFVIGYNFLKGKNVFTVSSTYYVEYEKVEGMTNSAMVLINGFQVGTVSDLYLKEDGSGKIIAVLMLDRGVEIPKNTVANIYSPDPLSGKAISLEYEGNCSDRNPCAQSGDTLTANLTGMLASMTGDLGPQVDKLKRMASGMVDSLKNKFAGGEGGDLKEDLTEGLEDLKATLSNLNSASRKLNRLLGSSSGQVTELLGNLNDISGNLKTNNSKITNIIDNAEQLTGNLKDVDLGKTMDGANDAIAELKKTLDEANGAIASAKTLLDKVSNGEGTIAQLMNDKKVYDNLNNSLRDLDFLLKDFRLNPKRYVNVSVIGRKSKPYEGVEDDPEGFQESGKQ